MFQAKDMLIPVHSSMAKLSIGKGCTNIKNMKDNKPNNRQICPVSGVRLLGLFGKRFFLTGELSISKEHNP